MSAVSDPAAALPSRYVVGIDLGTTNSAVCFVDTQVADWSVSTFLVPQRIAAGEIEARETLPSFLYQPAPNEFPPGALPMPWEEGEAGVVGIFAREQGKLVPGRVIESAKSWLCHPGVDRTSPLLPWHGVEDVPRLSPVDVSARYLGHIRSAWNVDHPRDPLEQQEVVITLPASFDEVARELTVAAARQAGIPRIVLIEEPQAAFYAWIHAHAQTWNTLVTPGQNILVCDIGGGTTDFTLIRVRTHPDQLVQFHRVAVGDHLILGGDNLDLALAQHLEQRFARGGQLDPRQWGSLVRSCRQVKEVLLSDPAPDTCTVTLPGTGSRFIGGAQQLSIGRDEARRLLLEGFFPRVSLHDRPKAKESGFQEFGLPYASDPAATKYLAAFLSQHLGAARDGDENASSRPDILLFNGGVFMSPLVQQRVIEVIQSWYAGTNPHWQPIVLTNDRHDLAVARGAAYYGMVRRGQGVRIAAGLPRTYYIGVETAADLEEGRLEALCLLPAGTEPGNDIDLSERTFQLTIGAPVEFPLYHSSLRLTDPAGALVPLEREQHTPLPPLRTVLRSRKEKGATTLQVQLHARLTEIGTLQIWCSEAGGSRTWQLQFDVRSATQTDLAAHAGSGEAAGVLDEQTIEQVRQRIKATFGPDAAEKPGGLSRRIAELLELSRDDWPPSLLRQIWDALMETESGRRKSADHEASWLNLLGFSLRPGYGVALDDWRVSETWKQLRGRLCFPVSSSLAQWWILWRRIAGGLPRGQQQALATPLIAALREGQRKLQSAGRQRKGGSFQEPTEVWRLLGGLERLPSTSKQELGDIALDILDDPTQASLHSALLWSLGRLGAREPFYGPLNEVVSPEVASQWVLRLMVRGVATPERLLAVMQLARRTGDRYRDLPEGIRNKAAAWLTDHDAQEAFTHLVQEGGTLALQTEAMVFGESLPVGLRLHST